MTAWIGLGLLAIAGIVFMIMDNPGETFGITDADLANLVTGVALLIWIGSSLFVSYRGRAGLAARQAATWLAIALAIMVVYTYRFEFAQLGGRLAGEILPGRPIETMSRSDDGARVVAITAQRGGQFTVEALVDGTHVRMLADTGATQIALTHKDARRIGFDPGALNFTVRISTANGIALAAPVTLKSVSVGGIEVRNARALVTRPGLLTSSLLGMSYLGRIGSFEISGGRLVLRE